MLLINRISRRIYTNKMMTTANDDRAVLLLPNFKNCIYHFGRRQNYFSYLSNYSSALVGNTNRIISLSKLTPEMIYAGNNLTLVFDAKHATLLLRRRILRETADADKDSTTKTTTTSENNVVNDENDDGSDNDDESTKQQREEEEKRKVQKFKSDMTRAMISRFFAIYFTMSFGFFFCFYLIAPTFEAKFTPATTWDEFVNTLLPSGEIESIQQSISSKSNYVIIFMSSDAIINGKKIESLIRLPVSNIQSFESELRAVEDSLGIAESNRLHIRKPFRSFSLLTMRLVSLIATVASAGLWFNAQKRLTALRKLAKKI